MINVIVPKSRNFPIYPKTQEMLDKFDRKNFTIRFEEGLYIYENRNNGTNPYRYQWNLYIDSDMWTDDNPNDIVFELIKCKQEIISPMYESRIGGLCAYDIIDGKLVSVKQFKTDLRVCDIVGAGFLLVSSTALLSMQSPYFRHVDMISGQTTEDVGFCINAKMNAGIRPVLHQGIKIEHYLGKPEVTVKW